MSIIREILSIIWSDIKPAKETLDFWKCASGFELRASKIGFGGIVNSALFCVAMVWAQAVFCLRELRAS